MVYLSGSITTTPLSLFSQSKLRYRYFFAGLCRRMYLLGLVNLQGTHGTLFHSVHVLFLCTQLLHVLHMVCGSIMPDALIVSCVWIILLFTCLRIRQVCAGLQSPSARCMGRRKAMGRSTPVFYHLETLVFLTCVFPHLAFCFVATPWNLVVLELAPTLCLWLFYKLYILSVFHFEHHSGFHGALIRSVLVEIWIKQC